MSDQPDPQEEIIETRLQHVPGDGMCQGWDVNVPYQPSVGAAGRDQPSQARMLGAAGWDGEGRETTENSLLVEKTLSNRIPA